MSTSKKISQLTTITSLADADKLTAVSNGANVNISWSNVKDLLGVTGTLTATGALLNSPVLFAPTAGDYRIRGMENGPGVSFSITPDNGIKATWNVTQDSTGVSLTNNLSDITPDIASLVAGQGISIVKNSNAITISNTVDPATGLENRIVVSQASDFSGTLDSTKEYFIDGKINLGTQSIQIPSGGLTISGYSFDLSSLYSNESAYTMFSSAPGGSGNVILKNIELKTSGAGSKVFNLTAVDSNRALEISGVNYTDCTSLGEIENYRQLFESGTGRLGGTPSLTFSGSWVGVRISTSIVRALSAPVDLFKSGAGLTFSGRFTSDINADLPATGALIDFSSSNFTNDESLSFDGARVSRVGVTDASDTTLYPNINADSIKSYWSNNTGLPNTHKYIKASITSEVLTTISVINTYYPLLGTFTVDTASHFDMPTNGQFRLLSGNGSYQVSGDLVIVGTAGEVIDIRVTKSIDGGSTFPTTITHIKRQINSLVSARDVAFFPINFIATLKKDDRVRIEVENTSSTNNVTAEIDSYFIVSEL